MTKSIRPNVKLYFANNKNGGVGRRLSESKNIKLCVFKTFSKQKHTHNIYYCVFTQNGLNKK